MADFQTWKNAVLGVGIDIDGSFGNQCVDVDLSWGQACFPGIAWYKVFPPVANAKDMLANYNPTYFERIDNNHADPNQVPQQGDVAIFNASPQAGYTATINNPSGHTGVVDSADSGGIHLIQQDGSNPSGTTFEKYRPWKYTECLGWLRPKLGATPAPPLPPAPPSTRILFLPSSVALWRVYNVNGPWVPGTEVGKLQPAAFPPGLTYDILGNPAGSMYVIQTEDFGKVAIYAGPDTVAQIS